MEALQDLIEEAKVRFVWWGICIFTICYFLSHTSKSMWMNIPISVLLAFALRTLTNRVEFRWKPPPSPRQTYLSYLEKKQVSVNDSRLSTAPPPKKWKRKIDSPIVQAAIEEFIDLILRDFVIDLWYSDITPDKEAPELIREIVLDALGEVAGRVKEVNLVDLLTRDMIDLVGDHIDMYRRNQSSIGVDVMGTLSCEERDERLKHHLMSSKELHPALMSSESEYKFLQQLMGGVIALVLRQREAQCPLVRSFAREFLTCLVIQPLINLASPVYINELIEYIVLNFDTVVNLTKMGGDVDSSKVHQGHPTSFGTADSGLSTWEISAVSCTQETDMALLAKVGTLREKTQEVSENSSSASHGGTIHPKTADWARVLDAATQRRTEVLAPENLENMWARGRNYKDKLNRTGKGRQVPRKKGLSNTDMHSSDLQKSAFVNRDENTKTDDKAIVQCAQGSSLTTESKHTKANEAKLSHSLVGESTSRGSIVDDINTRAVAGISSKARLKRSNSTSALKIEPNEKRANMNDTKGIIISEEFYSPDFGRQNMEQNFQGASDTVFHVETAPSPKLRCRVIGAYFEKIGSNSFAVYSIAVTDSENNTWFVKRRYRNFERLHRHLKDIPNYTLHLPPKRIFSSSTEDAFVHQRCIQLDRYLQDLLSIANVAEQHEVWDFLSVSSKNYSFGKSPSVMRTLAVNVDDAVDDIVRQFKGVSDGLMRKVVGSSPSPHEASLSVPYRNLSWNADDVGSQVSGPSSIERANSSSDEEDECDKDQVPASTELGTSAQSSGYHSDNELNERKLDAKDFHPLIIKQIEESRSVDFEKNGSESKSEWTVKDRTMSLPSVSANIDDPVGVPPEWSPPNVTVPALNLVDKIFQLNRRGWLRRQVFWISKQILQLVMEDAIDDWLLVQINMLRRDDVVAQGIRWVKDTLWPEGKFFLKLELNSGTSDETAFNHRSSQTSTRAAKSKAHPSSSFEAQLEAARRASDVKKLLLNGAPSALVSLIGQRQYRRCSRDIYYFLQSSICIKQLAYGGLELVIISIFPELRELVLDIHKKMRKEPGLPA